MISILCRYDKLIPIDDVVPHPDNENKHSEEQIQVLAKIIKKDGVRHPIMVSNLSGKICTGHGRLLAFKLLEMDEVPVEFQDFDDPIQELRVRTADNNIQQYSEMDSHKFKENLRQHDIEYEDLDLEEFGQVVLNVPDFQPGGINDQGRLDVKDPKWVQCPCGCKHTFDVNTQL